MSHTALFRVLIFSVVVLPFSFSGGGELRHRAGASKTSAYDDLVALFQQWREFQNPKLKNGVPDYSAAAMKAQYKELAEYRRRLDQIDPSGWAVPRQVDHKIVKAEMNGMDFDHRILQPWARNPAFYVLIHTSRSDVPEHEGPNAYPPIDTWTYGYPLTAEAAARLKAQIEIIPNVLEQARVNLTGDGRGLWMGGIRAMKGQSADLARLSEQVADAPGLKAAIQRAREATDQFRSWLEAQLPSKTGPSGVWKENYTWNLQKVHLVPSTWEQELTIMQRELARAHSSLRLEEHRNRHLKPQTRFQTAQEYDRIYNAAVDRYMRFMKEKEIITVRDYMDPALRARIGSFAPAEGLRGFFYEVSYRDPLVMLTHMHHWIELATMDLEPHANPIRRDPLPYNIFDARSEGLATGMEEMMMHTGMFDDSPRSRELVWIMLAQRAARAIAGLYLHSNDFSMEQAVEFAARWTPRGWMPADSETVWSEQHFYLQQPGYETSYIMGKIQIERLMAERALEQGDAFTLKGFMDEFRAAGLIPVSLIRWELTGNDDEIRQMEKYTPGK